MIAIEDLVKEVEIQAVRSSGKGGQHVNKASTKVEVYFDIDTSKLFTDDEKIVLRQKLSNRINRDNIIKVVCQSGRSQYRNKETAITRLYDLITQALIPVKPRTRTKPTIKSKENRLRDKAEKPVKKLLRNKRIDMRD